MTRQSRNIGVTNRIGWHKVARRRAKSSRMMMKICYSLINNIKYNIKYNIIIWLHATVHELSLGKTICRFSGFLIYNSARFVYISFTFPLNLLFLITLPKSPGHAILIDNLRHEWHLIDFKRFFLAKTLAKTCHQYHKTASPWFLKGFLFVECVMSLIYNALLQIVILI